MKLKRVGFGRHIRLRWLDAVAGKMYEHRDTTLVRKYLEVLLEKDILGNEARRKTIDVLTRIWIRVPHTLEELRDQALNAFIEIEPHERIWLHWGMILNSYPIFYDVVSAIGRLLSIQGEVSTGQIRRAIIEEWGDRTTIRRSVARIIQSIKDWSILQNTEKESKYIALTNLTSTNTELQIWLLEAALRAEKSNSIPLSQLFRIPALFPFKVQVPYTELYNSKKFEITQQGLDIQMISLRSKI